MRLFLRSALLRTVQIHTWGTAKHARYSYIYAGTAKPTGISTSTRYSYVYVAELHQRIGIHDRRQCKPFHRRKNDLMKDSAAFSSLPLLESIPILHKKYTFHVLLVYKKCSLHHSFRYRKMSFVFIFWVSHSCENCGAMAHEVTVEVADCNLVFYEITPVIIAS